MLILNSNRNGGWHVSLMLRNVAGSHCSHGCSLSTQADSPVSTPVSRPATHSSWVGEWEKVDPADTGRVMSGQYSDTISHGTQDLVSLQKHVCFLFVKLHFLGQILRFFTLLWETAVATCCLLTLPSLTNGILQDPQGPPSLGHM